MDVLLGLPRMRGDRPETGLMAEGEEVFTPHARGSTEIRQWWQQHPNVYPACAGIDLPISLFSMRNICLPRMRGDRP